MIADPEPADANNRTEAARRQQALRRYPSYRDSGLPWLGEVPEHWEIRRNGRLFTERAETGFEELPILEVSLRTGVRVRDMENGTRKQQMADRSKYKRAAKGDVAYNMMRMWQGAVGVAPVDGLISPAYVVARPFPEVDSRYYTYLFRTLAYKREVNKFSRGIVSDRNRLYWDEFKQMPSAFPPPEEQSRIAGLLDDHGRRTTRLIRNKRRLIGLLNEQKQAIINRAVTRGLNPDARMKPTGIDWMPEVPAHWDVLKLKRFSRMKSGDSITAERIDETGAFPVYGGNGLRGYTDSSTHDGTFALIGRQGALCGNVHRVSGTFWASEHAIVTTLEPPNDIEWFIELLRVMNLNQYSESAAQPGLAVDDIANLYAPRPPAEEQAEIARYFRTEFSELDAVLERTGSEIALIREYRERLIADVVTGKLDVRHVEIAAPVDEPIADEDDALDEDIETEDRDELAEVED